MKLKSPNEILIAAVVLSLLAGALGASIVLSLNPSTTVVERIVDENDADEPKTTEELITDFYLTETAVHVSPHHLRKAMDKGDDSYILVDVRSQEEYNREHILGAINIPAYKDPDTSAYGDVERIVSEFSKLPKDKDIIVYCYSTACMTGRKVGKILVENDIYVQQLGIGWNEWRYGWNVWNHEHEWDQTKVEDYITADPSFAMHTVDDGPSSCAEGELGC